MKYYIYTDGATSNNGRANAKGSWAAIFIKNEANQEYEIRSGGEMPTTNQRMELTGAIEGLSMIPKLSFGDEVILYTDSAYLCNCYLNKWYCSWERNGWRNSKKEPVANQDLWEKLIPYFKNPQITISKVKGHSGNYYNELVDELAVNEREKLM